MTLLNLRFLPWLRRGLARSVQADAANAYATIDFSFKVGGEPVSQTLRVRGPGDVVGIDPAQVVRVDPRPGTADFEPNYFPSIEFALPDLPWMFTPSAADGDQLLPWLTLVTVNQALAHIEAQQPLPVLHVPPGELPSNLREMWAWAHVQTTTLYEVNSLTQVLQDDPESFISRIISPRNLQPETNYLVCLVPTYKAGVLTGLGLPMVEDVGQTLAWTANESSEELELPVYYSWAFRTAAAGDFETLVERLQPSELDETVGRRDLDLSEIGIPLAANIPTTTLFFGALVSPTAIPDKSPTKTPVVDPLRQTIYDFLTADPPDSEPDSYDYRVDDPVVTPAIYGREQLNGAVLPPPKPSGTRATPSDEPVWYDDVNTHPRTRGAAGLGVRIVRQHQEDFMARAWSAVTSIRSINQTLQQATFASLVANRWQKRAVALGSGELLGLTRSAHARILPAASSKTIWGQLRDADLPKGSVSTDMQRITRSGGVVQHSFRLVNSNAAIQHEVRQVIVQNPARLKALSLHTLPIGATASFVAQPDAYAQPLAHEMGHVVSDFDAILVQSARPAEHPSAANTVLTTHRLAAGYVEQLDTLAKQGRTLTRQMQATRSAASLLADTSEQYIGRVAGGQQPGLAQIRTIRTQAAGLQTTLEQGGLAFPPAEPADELTLEPIAFSLSVSLRPDELISAHLQSRIQIAEGTWGARAIPSRLTAQPIFDEAIYPYVCALSPEYMLPGVGDLPANTVGLVEVNGEFVEAVLLGVNQEMSREMLWREYPTDLHSTWFTHFWSISQPDIQAIDTWAGNKSLGNNLIGLAGDDALVLLIKGDVIQRYPNLIIYAVQGTVTEVATRSGGKRRLRTVKTPEVQLFPAFSGQLENGVKFYGFDANQLTVAAALGDATPENTSSDGGYFFAFQEQPTEPRFGLDEYVPGTTYDPAALTTWSELNWGHVMSGDNPDLPTYLSIRRNFAGTTLPDTSEADSTRSTWGSSAAAMALITLQRPVRMLVHASAMLPEGS